MAESVRAAATPAAAAEEAPRRKNASQARQALETVMHIRDELAKLRASEGLKPAQQNERIRQLREHLEDARLELANAVLQEKITANRHSKEMELTSRGFKVVPDLAQLSQLQSLNLSYNLIRALPRNFFADFVHLESFSAVQNELSTLSDTGLHHATKLQILDVRWNKLTALPAELFSLTQLTTLELGYNRLSELQPQVTELHQLRLLSLDANPIAALPPLTDLSALMTLCISKCASPGEAHAGAAKPGERRGAPKRFDWPRDLDTCTQLRELYAVENGLADLPPGLGRLTNLRKLYLKGNAIAELGKELTMLTNLIELDLSRNALTLHGVAGEIVASRFLAGLEVFQIAGNEPLTREQLIASDGLSSQ